MSNMGGSSQSKASTGQQQGSIKQVSTKQGVNDSVAQGLAGLGGGKPQNQNHTSTSSLASLIGGAATDLANQSTAARQGVAGLAATQQRNKQLDKERSQQSEIENNPVIPRGDPNSGSFSNKGVAAPGKEIGYGTSPPAKNTTDRSRYASYAAWAVMLGLGATALYFWFDGSLRIDAKTPLGQPVGNVPKPMPYPPQGFPPSSVYQPNYGAANL